jgi:hypothetical protein
MAGHDGGKQPGESYLTGFARALKFKDDAELLLTAWNDRAEFCRRYAAVSPPCYGAHQVHPSKAKDYRDSCDAVKAKEAGDVCDVVIREFLKEELVHQVLRQLRQCLPAVAGRQVGEMVQTLRLRPILPWASQYSAHGALY